MIQYPLTLTGFLLAAFRRYTTVNIIITIAFLGWTLDQVAWPYVFKRLIDGISGFQGDRSNIWSALHTEVWMVLLLWATLRLPSASGAR